MFPNKILKNMLILILKIYKWTTFANLILLHF